MKFKYLSAIFVLLIAIVFVFFSYIELPYSVDTKGIIYPIREWSIVKTDDGSLLNILKNNSNNTVSYYSVMEFQRGDFAEFTVDAGVYEKKIIKKGDTIGRIRSNEEQRRFLELKGDLAAQQNLLQVYSTGAKPEDVKVAYNKKILAKQEYETQKKQTERNEILFLDEYISEEMYELSLNQYKVKLHRFEIAKSEYESLITGAKPEQLDYIISNIRTLETQILQLKKRMNSFELLSPFTGVMVKQHGNNNEERAVFRLADVSQYVVILPVELYQLRYIEKGQLISLNSNQGSQPFKAEITDIDNSVQIINFRQNVFITAAIIQDGNNLQDIIPNMVVEAEIDCGMIPAKEYLKRLFRVVYQN